MEGASFDSVTRVSLPNFHAPWIHKLCYRSQGRLKYKPYKVVRACLHANGVLNSGDTNVGHTVASSAGKMQLSMVRMTSTLSVPVHKKATCAAQMKERCMVFFTAGLLFQARLKAVKERWYLVQLIGGYLTSGSDFQMQI